MSAIPNDADLEMMELEEAGNMAAAGVCSICTDALDPIAYERAHPGSYNSPRYTTEIAAKCVGPVHPSLPFHVWCLDGES